MVRAGLGVEMLHPVQKKRYEKRFSTIESSFRIEGMDPSGDAIYESAKARVLSGSITPKQALEVVAQKSKSSSNKALTVTA